MRDLHAAQEAVFVGTNQDVIHQRMYQQWTGLCSTLSVNTTFQDSSIPCIELIRVYGHRVCHAQYSKHLLDLLGKKSVSQAWGEIDATHLLDGLSNPPKKPNPKLALACTSTSPKNSKLTGSKISYSSGKRPPPWASSTPLW